MDSSTPVNGKAGIIVGVIFGLFVLLFIGLAIKRREIAFDGEVMDKDIIENQVQNNNMPMNRPGINFGGVNAGVTHTYRIKVKTDAGKEINYQISAGLYEVIKIGDRVHKPKGTTEVSIVSSKENSPNTVTNTPPTTNNQVPPQSIA